MSASRRLKRAQLRKAGYRGAPKTRRRGPAKDACERYLEVWQTVLRSQDLRAQLADQGGR